MGLSLVGSIAADVQTTLVVTDSLLETVVDSTDEIVTTIGTAEGAQVTTLKLATMVFSVANSGYQLTFATVNDRAFVDWRIGSSDGLGLPMESFIEFAEFNYGSVHTRGQTKYVHSYFSKSSKNLDPGGYYELPPLYYKSAGLRMSQSVLEVLHKNASDVRLTQSIIEILHNNQLLTQEQQNLNEWSAQMKVDTAWYLGLAAKMDLQNDCFGFTEQFNHAQDYAAADALLRQFAPTVLDSYDSARVIFYDTRVTHC
jgi:hypothetical protein